MINWTTYELLLHSFQNIVHISHGKILQALVKIYGVNYVCVYGRGTLCPSTLIPRRGVGGSWPHTWPPKNNNPRRVRTSCNCQPPQKLMFGLGTEENPTTLVPLSQRTIRPREFQWGHNKQGTIIVQPETGFGILLELRDRVERKDINGATR